MKYLKFLVLSLLFAGQDLFASDPAISWKVLHSEHFEVIYDSRYKDQAVIFLNSFETAHKLLEPVFSEMPRKTSVLISDSSDDANGFATFIPYPLVVVLPVLPDLGSPVSYYEDWALELAVHEYTHILSMKPSNGFYRPLRWIFGNIMRPNAMLPRWYLEGVAVEMESRFTTLGRLRSPSTFAGIRALTEGDQWGKDTMDRVNESTIPTFPYGTRPYFYGSLLWAKITNEYGIESVDRLHQEASRRVPFFINEPVLRLTNKNFVSLLEEMFADYSRKARAQIEAIRRAGEEAAELITLQLPASSLSKSIAISPDHQTLLLHVSDPYFGEKIFFTKRKGPKESFRNTTLEPLIKVRGLNRISWLPGSNKFVYDRIQTWSFYYNFKDLYLYDMEKKKSERLTRGERASEPAASPDGQRIVYVKRDGIKTELKLYHLATKQSESLLVAPTGDLLGQPEFLSDQEIVYVLKRADQQKFFRLNLADKTARPFLEAYNGVSQPRRSASGLLFISTQSGTKNLYLSSKDHSSAVPVSNTTTEVLEGAFDPVSHELWSTRLTGTGTRLFVNNKPRIEKPPKLEPLVSHSPGWIKTSPPQEPTEYRDGAYWPIKYLFPRYWIPFIYPVEGGMLFQGSTGSSDPAQVNTYILDGGFDTVTDKWSYGFSFLNRSLPIGIQPTISEYQDYLASSDITLTQRFQSLALRTDMSVFSKRISMQVQGLKAETQTPAGVFYRDGLGAGISLSDFDLLTDPTVYAGSTYAQFQYVRYLDGGRLTGYERYQGALAKKWYLNMMQRHAFLSQLKGSYSPNLGGGAELVYLGDKTVAGNYVASLLNSMFMMRGYPSAAFVGKSIANLNFEYIFPLFDVYKGSGTKPWFLNDIQGAIFIDGVAVDGAYLNEKREAYVRSHFKKSYWSTGFEYRANTTLGYHFPLTFNLGFYYGFDEDAGGGFTTFLGLGYTPHEGIAH